MRAGRASPFSTRRNIREIKSGLKRKAMNITKTTKTMKHFKKGETHIIIGHRKRIPSLYVSVVVEKRPIREGVLY